MGKENQYLALMKALYIGFLGLFLLAMSCAPKPQKTVGEVKNDTIVTSSGLRYVYIKKGTGKPVERGAEVAAYLSLIVNDSVVWNTNEMPDSLFVFQAGAPNLIDGFNEMALLLKEGDEVSAFMPPSIAYGEGGTPGFVPPSTPITYNPFRVVKVSGPVTEKPDSQDN